ncbi:MAG: hypothetical protein ACOCYC_00825 [bacterium]
MKRYPSTNRVFEVKGTASIRTYLKLLKEHPNGFLVKITSVGNYTVKESEEYITKALLETCLRTGYLTECAEREPVAV